VHSTPVSVEDLPPTAPARAGRGARPAIIHADVGIIGAGPAGLATAIHLGQLGVGRVVLVDRQDFPRPKTCGSAVSPKGIGILKSLGVLDAVGRDAYWIRGFRLVTPRQHELTMSGHTDGALICWRQTLDHLLLQRAQALGCEFVANYDARFLLQRGDGVAGFEAADGRQVRAKYTVVADGAHSRFGLERGPQHMIQAIMGWWEGVPFEPNHLEMVFDSLVAPYYGWLFPEGPDRVNIGICYEDPDHSRNARQLFDAFLAKQYAGRIAQGRQLGAWKGHPISYSLTVGRLTSPGRIVVGEAGRMTHPATAEGIYQGMRSGMLAAQALHDILVSGAVPATALKAYETACREAFRTSFRSAALWRRLVNSGGLDVMTRALSRPPLDGVIARLMAHM
jgi:geranylgeranyl reductase family protein